MLTTLGQLGIIPVVRIDRVEDSLPLGRALIAGGLPCAEITFRTQAAEAAIGCLSQEFPDLILGAGTVVQVEQAKRAVKAGARFVVSPGFSAKVVEWCVSHGVAVLPGVATPTEVMMGLDLGVNVFKFFPAEAYGGIATLQALAAPFVGIKFMPTGGINATNLADYLRLAAVHACGGSWMVDTRLINAGRFDEISRLSAEAIEIVRRTRAASN